MHFYDSGHALPPWHDRCTPLGSGAIFRAAFSDSMALGLRDESRRYRIREGWARIFTIAGTHYRDIGHALPPGIADLSLLVAARFFARLKATLRLWVCAMNRAATV